MKTHNITHFPVFLLWMLWVLIASSCSVQKKTKTAQKAIQFSEPCGTADLIDTLGLTYPGGLHKNPHYHSLKPYFSENSLHVAHALNLMPSLFEYLILLKQLQSDTSITREMAIFRLSHNLSWKIQNASLQVSAITAEIDCEEERAEQIANSLQQKEDLINTRLTVAAIIVGAAGAITTGVIMRNEGFNPNTVESLGIGVGISEAILGMSILLNKKKAQFRHPRNFLKEIWDGPQKSSLFPPYIWYYLNTPLSQTNSLIEGTKDENLRIRLKSRWEALEQLGNKKRKKESIDLVMGEGGKYTAELLKKRANMLDQLEAQIGLIKQDLNRLSNEILDLENRIVNP